MSAEFRIASSSLQPSDDLFVIDKTAFQSDTMLSEVDQDALYNVMRQLFYIPEQGYDAYQKAQENGRWHGVFLVLESLKKNHDIQFVRAAFSIEQIGIIVEWFFAKEGISDFNTSLDIEPGEKSVLLASLYNVFKQAYKKNIKSIALYKLWAPYYIYIIQNHQDKISRFWLIAEKADDFIFRQVIWIKLLVRELQSELTPLIYTTLIERPVSGNIPKFSLSYLDTIDLRIELLREYTDVIGNGYRVAKDSLASSIIYHACDFSHGPAVGRIDLMVLGLTQKSQNQLLLKREALLSKVVRPQGIIITLSQIEQLDNQENIEPIAECLYRSTKVPLLQSPSPTHESAADNSPDVDKKQDYLYQKIINDQLFVPVLLLDVNLKLKYFNRMACLQWRSYFKNDLIIGKSLIDLTPQNHAQSLKEVLKNHIDHNEAVDSIYLESEDLHLSFFDCQSSGAQRLVGLSILDRTQWVTKVDQFAPSLLQAEAQLSASLQPMLLVNQRFELVKMNTASESLLFVGSEFSQDIYPIFDYSHEQMCQHLNLLLKTEALEQPQLIMPLKEHAKQEIGFTINQIIKTYQNHYFLFSLVNLNDMKIMQQQLHQSQKMQSVGLLASGIAHDFNNMLAAIVGHAELAHMNVMTDNLAHKNKQYLSTILQASEQARKLVTQLLDYSKTSPDNLQKLNLQVLLSTIVDLVTRYLPSKYNLKCEFHTDADVMIEVDSSKFEQIIMNLCINARDAMPQGGTITVITHARKMHGVSCHSCQKHVRGEFFEIAIKDEGEGIALNDVSRLFEPFFTTKEVGKGTGMGLAVVHGIMHQFSGHIFIDSLKEIGTSVKLWFPVIENTSKLEYVESTEDVLAKIEQVVSEKTPCLTGKQVVVVEDSDVVASFYEAVLEDLNMDVVVFHLPRQALEYIKHAKVYPDLFIVDYNMPDMTGIEFLQSLEERGVFVPSIMSSGDPRPISEHEVNKIKMLETVLCKPVNVYDLHENITKIITPHKL